MSEPRVIRADYANWRPVAGRKVLQLVFEVPIEQTADVLEKLGVPMPGESRWCAVALLESGACASESSDGARKNALKPSYGLGPGEVLLGQTPTPISAPTVPDGTSPKEKERRPFATLPLSQQAAIRCQDNDFKLFMDASNADDAAEQVRVTCGITSRAHLDDKAFASARAIWTKLETEFQAWVTTQRYAEARHG